MKLRLAHSAALLLLACTSAFAQNLTASDGDTVTLQGTLLRLPVEIVEGETLSGDTEFVAIELATPLDFACPAQADDACEAEQGQERLHLVISGDANWEAFEAGLDAPAQVTGQLMHAHTQYHHTAVLLVVEEIAPLAKVP